jgi:hypothetical protein
LRRRAARADVEEGRNVRKDAIEARREGDPWLALDDAVAQVDEAVCAVVALRAGRAAGAPTLYSRRQVDDIVHELEKDLRELRENLASPAEELRDAVRELRAEAAAAGAVPPQVVELLLRIEAELRKADHHALAESFDGHEVAYLLTRIDVERGR